MKGELEAKSKLAVYFENMLKKTKSSDTNYNLYIQGYERNSEKVTVLESQISALREQRAGSVYNDPLFNTTGIISDQNNLEDMPYGSQGNAAANSCGAVSVQNALTLLGETSNFADVYTYFNDDSKLNLGGLAGGSLGTSPFAVMDYLEDSGFDATIREFNPDDFIEAGVAILVYFYQTDAGNLSAHFKAFESDGNIVNTYNNTDTYYVNSIDKEHSTKRIYEDFLYDSDYPEIANWINKLPGNLEEDDLLGSYIITIK